MIPKPKYTTYNIYIRDESKDLHVFSQSILNGLTIRIAIPDTTEKYRIPHELASYIETELQTYMLTEEERQQVNQEDKTAYNKGLADAWEVLRKLQKMPCTEFYKLFPCCEGMGNAITELIRRMTPAEAIAKIKDYEEEQQKIEQEIKVGDEVFMDYAPNEAGIVTRIYPKGKIYIMWEDGVLGRYDILNCKKNRPPLFTGRGAFESNER